MKYNKNRILKRKMRVSTHFKGTAERPRISVHRSNLEIYAQAVDDSAAKTIVSASSHELKEKKTKTEKAQLVGELLAKKMLEKNVAKAIFDRGRFTYNGRVKALAEGVRSGGITV